MSNIIVRENESLDSALRRFKRSCAKAGIQQEIRKREHYEKPSVRRKKKSEAARKRAPGLSSRGFCRINAERKSGGGSMMHPNAAHVQCVQRKPSAGACSCLKLPEMG